VKINRPEFDLLARGADAGDAALASVLSPENPMPARLDAARRRWPAVRGWVVTDGARPVWHAAVAPVADEQRWTTVDDDEGAAAPGANGAGLSVFQPFRHSAISSCQPPAIREVSPTGAGDVLFACILHGLVNRGVTLAEAVAEGLPFAAAKAAEARQFGRAGAD
jgi:sugar/nucleoside kinase (ribokinase family)